ncbi:MAG: hypothetical protein K0R54_815 [Clostridiaceae bacterium]|jgi:hypothetical protein|nr:hypothetical protein [Clostridiaceae bacterium]
MKYYFNGGLYKIGFADNRKFDAVSPSNGLPYVTNSKEGIRNTSHHSSVYQISEDFKTAKLIKDNGTVPSPKNVNLPYDLEIKLRKSVEASYGCI